MLVPLTSSKVTTSSICRILGRVGESEREREEARLAGCKRVRYIVGAQPVKYLIEWRVAM